MHSMCLWLLGSAAVFNISNDLTTLQASGIKIGSISGIGQPYKDGMLMNEMLNDACYVAQTCDAVALTGDDVAIEVEKVLLAGSSKRMISEAEVMENLMKRRRFFVTQTRFMCIGPMLAELEDCIYIYAGCDFPMILRPEGEHHILVGEAYGESRIEFLVFH